MTKEDEPYIRLDDVGPNKTMVLAALRKLGLGLRELLELAKQVPMRLPVDRDSLSAEIRQEALDGARAAGATIHVEGEFVGRLSDPDIKLHVHEPPKGAEVLAAVPILKISLSQYDHVIVNHLELVANPATLSIRCQQIAALDEGHLDDYTDDEVAELPRREDLVREYVFASPKGFREFLRRLLAKLEFREWDDDGNQRDDTQEKLELFLAQATFAKVAPAGSLSPADFEAAIDEIRDWYPSYADVP